MTPIYSLLIETNFDDVNYDDVYYAECDGTTRTLADLGVEELKLKFDPINLSNTRRRESLLFFDLGPWTGLSLDLNCVECDLVALLNLLELSKTEPEKSVIAVRHAVRFYHLRGQWANTWNLGNIAPLQHLIIDDTDLTCPIAAKLACLSKALDDPLYQQLRTFELRNGGPKYHEAMRARDLIQKT